MNPQQHMELLRMEHQLRLDQQPRHRSPRGPLQWRLSVPLFKLSFRMFRPVHAG